MPGLRLNFPRPLFLIAVAMLVALVVFGQLPVETKLSHAVQDAAHAPAFFFLALLVLQLCNCRYRRAFLICIALGAAIELIQALTGRDASVKDVWTDALGTLAGLSAYGWAQLAGKTARGKALLLTLSVVSIVAACVPLAWASAAYIHRDVRLPVLAQFHSPLDLYFLETRYATLKMRDSSLTVYLEDGPWAGVALTEPWPDWSSYRRVTLELENPGSATLSLVLRVHDAAHNHQIDDRFNLLLELPAGSQKTVSVELERIRDAPQTRAMDMRAIAAIIIFAKDNSAGRSFILRRVRLD